MSVTLDGVGKSSIADRNLQRGLILMSVIVILAKSTVLLEYWNFFLLRMTLLFPSNSKKSSILLQCFSRSLSHISVSSTHFLFHSTSTMISYIAICTCKEALRGHSILVTIPRCYNCGEMVVFWSNGDWVKAVPRVSDGLPIVGWGSLGLLEWRLDMVSLSKTMGIKEGKVDCSSRHTICFAGQNHTMAPLWRLAYWHFFQNS